MQPGRIVNHEGVIVHHNIMIDSSERKRETMTKNPSETDDNDGGDEDADSVRKYRGSALYGDLMNMIAGLVVVNTVFGWEFYKVERDDPKRPVAARDSHDRVPGPLPVRRAGGPDQKPVAVPIGDDRRPVRHGRLRPFRMAVPGGM